MTVLSFNTSFPLADCDPEPEAYSLRMSTIPQEEDNWCWAAVGEMAMEYVGNKNIKQCDEANTGLRGIHDCCSSSSSSDHCNRTGWPPFEAFGFNASYTEGNGLVWDDLKKQIYCLKSPICVLYHYDDWDSNHFVVISGYKKQKGYNCLLQRDPDPRGHAATSWIKYSDYQSSDYQKHIGDYYNITMMIKN